MNKPLTVRFSDDEVNALGQMLDIALKAGGKQVVYAYMAIDRKMSEAIEKRKAEENEAEEA